jgi:hypothetical protein
MSRSGRESKHSQATSELAPEELAELMAQSEKVEAAVQASARDALVLHKRLGHAIVVWENEQVVWIPPEEIEIPQEPSGE